MARSETAGPSDRALHREISMFLRAAEEPDALTFKQIRLAVETSLGLRKDSLHTKAGKARIKGAVHSVMDEIDSEKNNNNNKNNDDNDDDLSEEEAEFEGVRRGNSTATTAPPPPSGRNNKKSNETTTTSSAKSSRKRAKVGDDGRNGAKKAAKQKKAGSGNTGGKTTTIVEDRSLVCVLGETNSGRRQINVVKWKGNVQVDIRHYYRKEPGVFAPGLKGISLNASQFKLLTSPSSIDFVDRAIRRVEQSLGK